MPQILFWKSLTNLKKMFIVVIEKSTKNSRKYVEKYFHVSLLHSAMKFTYSPLFYYMNATNAKISLNFSLFAEQLWASPTIVIIIIIIIIVYSCILAQKTKHSIDVAHGGVCCTENFLLKNVLLLHACFFFGTTATYAITLC